VPVAEGFPVGDGPAACAIKLFAESAGRFLVEVAPEHAVAFRKHFQGVACGEVGKVTDTARIVARANGSAVLDARIAEAKDAWQSTFRW
jgi:phosphoribosylformylglycinamidine synthase